MCFRIILFIRRQFIVGDKSNISCVKITNNMLLENIILYTFCGAEGYYCKECMKNWGLLPEELGRLGNIFFVHFEGKTRVEMNDMVTYYDPHSVISNIYYIF